MLFRSFNPLAIMRRHRGFMLPMLFTATGHVFLAFCPDSVRGTLLDLMARSDDERHAPSRRRHETDQKLAAIRNDGYFIFELDGYAEGGCAVPVSVRGNVVGAVAMKYIMTAIRPAQVKKQWLPALREVCRTLGDRLVAANSQ